MVRQNANGQATNGSPSHRVATDRHVAPRPIPVRQPAPPDTPAPIYDGHNCGVLVDTNARGGPAAFFTDAAGRVVAMLGGFTTGAMARLTCPVTGKVSVVGLDENGEPQAYPGQPWPDDKPPATADGGIFDMSRGVRLRGRDFSMVAKLDGPNSTPTVTAFDSRGRIVWLAQLAPADSVAPGVPAIWCYDSNGKPTVSGSANQDETCLVVHDQHGKPTTITTPTR